MRVFGPGLAIAIVPNRGILYFATGPRDRHEFCGDFGSWERWRK